MMKQLKTFSDVRLDQMCTYCGDIPNTRDHVPSKILLEDPFPENLPVVPCCNSCNQGFSFDEEYFACAIECILYGTTEPDKLKREKIKSILLRRQKLKADIENSFIDLDGEKFFKYDESRFENVILKLAKGHAKFENSEVILEIPESIVFKPLTNLSDEEYQNFFSDYPRDLLPEVGSRAFIQLYLNQNNYQTNSNSWIEVQQDVYSYCVIASLGAIRVKIAIWNYLAIEVIWDEKQ